MPITVPINLDVQGGGLASAVTRDLASAEAAANRAGSRTGAGFSGGFRSGMGDLSKSLKATGGAITGVGQSLTLGLTAPIAAVGVASVNLASDFETTMNTLQAATGSSSADMAAMEKQAKSLGASTAFSAGEASEAMLELGKSGQSTEQIMATVPQVMNLAATEGLKLSDAAGAVTSALAQFGLQADQSGRVVNALAGAANASRSSVAGLSSSFSLVGSAAAAVGFSVEDTASALAALSANGLEGSIAGTSLSAVLNKLVPTTDKASSAMKRLGLDFTRADGSFKSVQDISGELAKAFGGMSEEARKVAIGEIFGNDASTIAAVNGLVNTGADDWAKYAQATRDQSAASSLADARMKGTAGAVEQMQGALETAGLSIGQALAPSIVTVSRLVARMANAFSALPKGVQTGIIIFAALAAAIGPLLIIIGGVISAVGAIAGVFAAVSVPVLAVVAVIALLVGAFAAFMIKSEEARAVVVGVFQQIAAIVKPAIQDIANTFKSDILPAMQAAWPTIEKVGVVLLKAFGASIVNQVRAFVAVIKGIVRAVAITVGSIRAFVSAVKAVIGAVKATAANTRIAFTNIRNSILNAMNSARAVVASAIQRIISVVTGGLSRVRGAFSSGFSAARSVVTGAMSSIRSAISSGISRVVSLVASLPGRVRGALGGLGSALFSSGVSLINGFASGIRSAIGNAVSAASEAVSAVRGFFPFSPAKEGPFSGSGYTTYSGEALMKDFAKSMEDTANAVAPQVAASLNPFASAIPSVAGRPAGSSTSRTTTINNGVDVAALATLMSQITLNVTLGRDRRTTAEWWLDGQQLAASLS